MKSAWMLITLVGLVLVSAAGCAAPSWGISPPIGRSSPRAEPMEQPAIAALPGDASAASGDADEADPADPAVAELTRKIEALAERPAADHAGESPAATHVESAATATQPAAAPTMRVHADNPSLTPGPSLATGAAPSAGATTSASPAPVGGAPAVAAHPGASAPPAATLAPEPVTGPSMVANAPTGVARATETRTEAAASPSPRTVPLVQPTDLSPAQAVTVTITDVRPVLSSLAVHPDPSLAAANQPAQAEPPQPRPADLEAVITQMEQTLEQRPPHPEDELRLRLLYLAAGMDHKLTEPVKGMDPIQSELLQAIVQTVTSSRQAMLEPLDSGYNAISAADELRRLLGQQTGVSIPRMALVTKVSSYGDYELISPPVFKAGNEIHAYLYTEVANFRCEPVDGDRLRTLLGERVQVFNAAGTVVWERHEKNIEDKVRTPRRDFFIPFPLRLPATLPAGDYVLKVTIEDHIGGTTDQQRLSFTIQ